jgi:hypothetical protein
MPVPLTEHPVAHQISDGYPDTLANTPLADFFPAIFSTLGNSAMCLLRNRKLIFLSQQTKSMIVGIAIASAIYIMVNISLSNQKLRD